MPNTYQRTTSVPAMGRFAAVHFASPASLALRFGKSPAGLPARHLEDHARLAQAALSAHDALLDGRLGHERRARSPGVSIRRAGGVSAPPRFGREDRVAGNENEAQEIVADMIVERCVEVWWLVVLDLELVAELGVLAAGKLGAAEEIDRAMLCCGHQPWAGLLASPLPEP